MTPLRRLAVAVVGATLAVVPAWQARAASPSAVGYWWRLQKSGSPLPPPAFVPSGGLWTAMDPKGQLAVAALRYRARAGEQIDRVVLHVAQANGNGAVLLACPARSDWKPAQAGPWADRPASGCDSASVSGVASSDGSTWSFDVRGLARSGTLDVVILPPADANSSFSIAFNAPDRTSIVTEQTQGSPSPTAAPTQPGPTPRPTSSSSHPNVPSPVTTVLAEKTTPPVASSPAQTPAGVAPSPGQTTLAFPQLRDPPYRSRAVMAIALVLPIAVLGGILRYRWYA